MITNDERRERAQLALNAYPAVEPEEVLQSITNLITDLLHLAERVSRYTGTMFSAKSTCTVAIMHYEAEYERRDGE